MAKLQIGLYRTISVLLDAGDLPFLEGFAKDAATVSPFFAPIPVGG